MRSGLAAQTQVLDIEDAGSVRSKVVLRVQQRLARHVADLLPLDGHEGVAACLERGDAVKLGCHVHGHHAVPQPAVVIDGLCIPSSPLRR